MLLVLLLLVLLGSLHLLQVVVQPPPLLVEWVHVLLRLLQLLRLLDQVVHLRQFRPHIPRRTLVCGHLETFTLEQHPLSLLLQTT